jgi:hypothetical protein
MRKLLISLIIPLLVVGCGGAGGTNPSGTMGPSAGSTATPATTRTPANTYAAATDPDKLVVRLDGAGGFVAPGYLLTRLPIFALYGDGRVIVGGPVDAIYPAALLPNLRQMSLKPAEIQQVLAAADADGLLGPDASYNATNVADAGTSVFTTIVGGMTHTISAYALTESGTADSPGAVAARTKLLDFSNKISDLSRFLGRTVSDAETYAATGMRVFIGPAIEAPDSLGTPALVWPLTLSPLSGRPTNVPGVTCLAIGGSDLAAFLKVAAGANVASGWSAPSGRFSVSVRPLYPDESGCPATGT